MTGTIVLIIFCGIVWFIWKTMYKDNVKADSEKTESFVVRVWKSSIIAKVVIVLLGLGFLSGIMEKLQTPSSTPPAPAPQVSDKFKQMSPGEHLINAKKAVETKNFGAAKTHLDAIPKAAPEYAEVDSLQKDIAGKQKKQESEGKLTSDDNQLKAIEKRINDLRTRMGKYYATPDDIKQTTQDVVLLTVAKTAYSAPKNDTERRIHSKCSSLLPKAEVTLRNAYASSVENIFMKTGMDMRVKAVGSANKTLRLTYALMSKPLVYKFQNEIKLDEQAKAAGFSKLVFTNGFESSLGQTWTIDLK